MAVDKEAVERRYSIIIETITNSSISPKLVFVKIDSSSYIDFTFRRGSKDIDITGMTATITVKRPDNSTSEYGDILPVNGVFEWEIPPGAINQKGGYTASISVYNNGRRYTSSSFKYMVNDTIDQQDITKDPNYPVLASLITETQNVKDLTESNYQKALISSAAQASLEVVAARKGMNTLDAKIDLIDSHLTNMAKQTDLIGAIRNSFLLSDNIKRRNLTQVKNAITSNSCNISFWGDSITAMSDSISYFSGYPYLFERLIRDAFPSCTFTVNNFGIGGRTIDQAASSTYLASSDPNVSSSVGFNTGWGVIGKSWRDHVKDSNPDLVIVAFGMNSYSSHKTDDSLISIYNYIQSWTKIPTILMIPNYLPNPLWASDWKYRLEAQRTERYFAEYHNLPCADIGRVHRLLRDGVDEGFSIATQQEKDLTRYSGSNTTNTANGFTINSGGQISHNDRDLLNFEFQFKFDFTGSEQFLVNYIRGKYHIRYSPASGILQLRNDATLAVIDSFTAPILPNGSYTVRIQVYNSRIRVEVLFNFIAYLRGATNGVSFTVGVKPITGSINIYNLVLTKFDFNPTAALLTDSDFLNTYVENDFTTKTPYGGNGVNHPSSKGVEVMYQGELQKFVNAL